MNKIIFPKGSIIYRQGQVIRSVFVVKRGKVRLYFSDGSGKVFSFDLVAENEVFGSFGESEEFAEAFEDVELLSISNNQIDKMNRKTLLWILEKLSERYQISKARVKQLALMSLEERIIQTAFWLAEKLGYTDDRKVVLNLSHEDFAYFCGATRECVSKALSQMKGFGIVETGRKKIVLYITEKSQASDLKY